MKAHTLLILVGCIATSTQAHAQTASESYSALRAQTGVDKPASSTRAVTDPAEKTRLIALANSTIAQADADYEEAKESYSDRMAMLALTKTDSNSQRAAVETLQAKVDSQQARIDAATSERDAYVAALPSKIEENARSLASVNSQIDTLKTSGAEPWTYAQQALELKNQKQALESEAATLQQDKANGPTAYNESIKRLEAEKVSSDLELTEAKEEAAMLSEVNTNEESLRKDYEAALQLAEETHKLMVEQGNTILTQVNAGYIDESEDLRMKREIETMQAQKISSDDLAITKDLGDQAYINYMMKRGYSDDLRVGLIRIHKHPTRYLQPTKKARDIMQSANEVIKDDKRTGVKMAGETAGSSGLVVRITVAENDFRNGKYNKNYYMGEASAAALLRRVTFNRKLATALNTEVTKIYDNAADDAANDKRGLDKTSTERVAFTNLQNRRVESIIGEKVQDGSAQKVDAGVERGLARNLTGGDKYDVTAKVAEIRGSNLRADTQAKIKDRTKSLDLGDEEGTVEPTTTLRDHQASLDSLKNQDLREDTQAKMKARLDAAKIKLTANDDKVEPSITTAVQSGIAVNNARVEGSSTVYAGSGTAQTVTEAKKEAEQAP